MFIWILLTVLFLIALVGGGYFAYTKYAKKDSSSKPTPTPTPTPAPAPNSYDTLSKSIGNKISNI